MRKVNILNNKFKLEDDIEAIFEGEVKPMGNGAMVIATKRHIGKKVYLLIRK
jgi:putative transposon-encoded protein